MGYRINSVSTVPCRNIPQDKRQGNNIPKTNPVYASTDAINIAFLYKIFRKHFCPLRLDKGTAFRSNTNITPTTEYKSQQPLPLKVTECQSLHFQHQECRRQYHCLQVIGLILMLHLHFNQNEYQIVVQIIEDCQKRLIQL